MAKKKKALDPLAGYISTTSFVNTPQNYSQTSQSPSLDFNLQKNNIHTFPSPNPLGRDGTAIYSADFVTGVVNNPFYTVPSDKIFFLSGLCISAINRNGVAPGNGAFGAILFNDAPLISVPIYSIGQNGNQSISFSIPLRLKGGDKISLYSNNANVDCWANIFGQEFSNN